MKRLLHRVLSHAQFGTDLSLEAPAFFANEEFFKAIEQGRVVRGSVLRFQSSEHLLQHRQGPVPFVKPVSTPGFRQLKIGGLRLEQFVQRDMGTRLISFNSTRAVPLAGQKTFERYKQIRTQTSLLAPHSVQISVFKHTRKEFLDNILR